jgi:hypothetical protein
MGVISGTGISEQVPIFYGVRVAQSLVISVYFVEHCRHFVLFFWPFYSVSFLAILFCVIPGHFILCHSWPFYSVSFLAILFCVIPGHFILCHSLNYGF